MKLIRTKTRENEWEIMNEKWHQIQIKKGRVKKGKKEIFERRTVAS